MVETELDTFPASLEEQEAAYWTEYYRGVPSEGGDVARRRLVNIDGVSIFVDADIDMLALNRVLGLGITSTATEAQIDTIIEVYRAAGVGRFFVQLSPHAEPAYLPSLLESKGFHFHNNWIKLCRTVKPLPAAVCDFRIEEIGRERADVFADMIVRSFGWEAALRSLLAAPVGRRGYRHYLAYDGARAVAGAALFTQGDMASLALAATLPEYRGRGAQSALIVRRFKVASEAGCRLMVSETAEEKRDKPVASFRNMVRLGFDVVYKRPNYIFNF